MPFLLRAISKPRWYSKPWLKTGKAQAMALWDLRPTENRLSFWYVENDKSNLPKVVAAIAAGRDGPDKLDYALFDQDLLTNTGVKIKQTAGDSYHKEADENWHRDVAELSAENVAEIANIIMEHGIKDRIFDRDVTRLVKQEVTSGAIDVYPLKDRLKKKGLSNWLE
jgi:hypothetical protein